MKIYLIYMLKRILKNKIICEATGYLTLASEIKLIKLNKKWFYFKIIPFIRQKINLKIEFY